MRKTRNPGFESLLPHRETPTVMNTIEKLQLVELKQEIVKSEIEAVKRTIQELLRTKRAMERHHTDLLVKMMTLSSEGVQLKNELNKNSTNQLSHDNT